jgi:N-acetylneuraminate synthase
MKIELSIGNNWVGAGHPTYIIAEISANHRQIYSEAESLVRAAKDAGANAVKVQTYTADTLTIEADTRYFQIGTETIWAGRTLYDLYQEAYMPWDWQPKLQALANDIGIDFFSTAYDNSAVDFLESMEVPVYKIASFELVDLPLIRRIAATGKPAIISTGMATLAEIDEAVRAFRDVSETPFALLKCTSAYPAPAEEMNLKTIPHLREAFSCPVGLSDHTLGISVPVGAVAVGASIIEKHLTLSRGNESLDSNFSLEPEEFGVMVESVRTIEKALGKVAYFSGGKESQSVMFRRSLFVVEDMKANEEFTEDNVRSIRPAYGLHPRYVTDVLGRHAVKDIDRGTPLQWDLLA